MKKQLYFCKHCGPVSVFLNLIFCSLPVTWCTTSLTFNNCRLCPHCIYVFCIYLRTDSDLCHLQHKLIGFYSRGEKCLQRGTDWVFKYSGLRFVCKGLRSTSHCNIWEKTATCATYSINWFVFIAEMKSVYSAVRTGSLNKAVCGSSVKG
jgi:hypothetical protein